MPKEIVNIDNHYEQAVDRLPEQYRNSPKIYSGSTQSGWDGLLNAFTDNAQSLEDIMQSMLEERGLDTSEGVNLDRIGQIVGDDRQGKPDAEYLDSINGKIAENNSDGTESDIMLAIKRFVTADGYQYWDLPIAKFRVTLDNPTTPINTRVYKALNTAKVAGVGYAPFTLAPAKYLAFSNDPSVDGGGFAVWDMPRYSFKFSVEDLYATDRISTINEEPYTVDNAVVENSGYYGVNQFEKVGQSFVATDRNIVGFSTTSVANINANTSSVMTGYIFAFNEVGQPVGSPIHTSTNTVSISVLGYEEAEAGTEITFNFNSVVLDEGVGYGFMIGHNSPSGFLKSNPSSISTDPIGDYLFWFNGQPTAIVDGTRDNRLKIFYGAGDKSLRFAVDDDAYKTKFVSELNSNMGSAGGVLALRDKSNVRWEITTISSGLSVSETAKSSGVEIDLDLSSGNATITKNGSPSTISDLLADFDGYEVTDVSTYQTNNVYGIVESEDVTVYDSDAGNYSTLLLNDV